MTGRRSNKVQVIVPGVFHGQIVDVLQVKKKSGHTSYQLDVNWNGIPRPSWFGANEFRIIRPKGEREASA